MLLCGFLASPFLVVFACFAFIPSFLPFLLITILFISLHSYFPCFNLALEAYDAFNFDSNPP